MVRSVLEKQFSSFGLNSVKLVLFIIGLVCQINVISLSWLFVSAFFVRNRKYDNLKFV